MARLMEWSYLAMVSNLNGTRDTSKCIDRQSGLRFDVYNWIVMKNICNREDIFFRLPIYFSLSLSLSVWTKVFLFLYAFSVDNENANSTAFFLLKSSSVWKFYRWIHAVINLCLVINVLNLCMHSFFEFSIGYADAYCGWAFQYRKIICGIVGNGSQGNNLREEKSFTLMY